MLLHLALFCLSYAVINATPINVRLLEDIEHMRAIQTLESVDKILSKVVQHSMAVQQSAAARSLEANETLALLARDCSTRTRDIESERNNLLVRYYNCSILYILEDVVSVGIDSTKYVYNTYKDSTIIVGYLLACTNAGFNPFMFITCILKSISVIPAEIRDIIAITKAYELSLDTLLPRIYQGVESCFNKTASGYEKFLNELVEEAKVCDNSISSI